jgi:hypothetical protein
LSSTSDGSADVSRLGVVKASIQKRTPTRGVEPAQPWLERAGGYASSTMRDDIAGRPADRSNLTQIAKQIGNACREKLPALD